MWYWQWSDLSLDPILEDYWDLYGKGVAEWVMAAILLGEFIAPLAIWLRIIVRRYFNNFLSLRLYSW